MGTLPKASHAGLVRSIIEAIELARASTAIWKMQSGLFKSWRDKPVGRIGCPGVPDICGITLQGKFLGIEVKVGRDKQRKSQLDFQEACRGAGAHYILVNEKTDLSDLITYLRKI